MGVKFEISLDELSPFFKAKSLTPTTDGSRDSVYILDDKYVLKIFENRDEVSLCEELKILNMCRKLPVAEVLKEPFVIRDREALIYKKCKGRSLKIANLDHIEQIGEFLKEFHKITKNQASQNREEFSKDRLKYLIFQTKKDKFLDMFKNIDIELNIDGVVHGDLFLDNATFCDDKLSCVFDFSQSCNGDFLFDLGVVALSWCDSAEKIETLLQSYGSNISLEHFWKYIRYAGLYYCVSRYLQNRDYEDLWQKIV